MAVYFIPKDKKSRVHIKNFEMGRLKLHFFLRNSTLTLVECQKMLLLSSTSLTRALSFSVRARNRCVLTGRAGSVSRYFKVSRILLKEMASRGLLVGVRKSS